ncbi:MAG: MFS transporter [Planctomycetia bacterium]|nr:MFS transporter [Planctomycetia bacterium]
MQNERPAPSVAEATSGAATGALPWNVRLLGLASLLNDIASEMIYPLLPTFLITVLGGTTSQLGAVEGVADTTASIVKLWAGGLSDRAGKRKVFVTAGYALAAVSRPLIALATMPWQVLLVRSSDRFGKGIRSAPRDALVADSTDPSIRGRAFGFTRAMDHLGAAIGPLLAFTFLWVWPDHLRPLFLLAAVPGMFVVLLVLFGLSERPIVTRADKDFQLTLRPFDRNFRVYLVALVIFTLGNSSDAFLLVRVGELGVPATQLPLLWCAFHIVKSSGSVLAGQAVDRFGPRLLIYGGWLIYALIYLAFSLATNAIQGWAFFLIYGLFYALTEPAERTLVANLVGAEQKGLAYGWFNFAIGIAALPSSLIFGALYQWYGGSVAFTWSAVLALLAVVVLRTVKRT